MKGGRHFKRKILLKWIGIAWVSVLCLLVTGCKGAAKDNKFTIGIVSYVSVLDPVIEGFKAGMADLGYTQGENLAYIYNGVVAPNPNTVDAEIKKLLDQDIDLLFSVGNLASMRAKQAVKVTGIPVVFGSVVKPVEEGLVKSIVSPGGNLTGTQVGDQIPKALEWLITITPKAKKIYVPYNPDDEVSELSLIWLVKIQSQLGIELVPGKVKTVAAAVIAINDLAEDIDAIFRIPSPTLDPQNDQLSRAAIKRRLPMGTCVPLDEAVLITYAADFFKTGKQTARLAHQIHQGVKPADLPVEIGHTFFSVNLKTAEAIGIDIPREILVQANQIIR